MHVERQGPYRFCPLCSGTLESRLLKKGDPARLVCTACGYVVYFDPKVAVGTIISMPNNEIVLVRRAIEPGYGLWVFPGGYVDRGEVVTDAALREAREEAGLEIRLDGLISIYSYPRRLDHDEESIEIATFSADQVPWKNLAFQSTHEALRDYYAGVLHPHCK